ncbi:hypothetical protein A3J23_03725 [Candidatus Peregrinibacteria bacterium RIFCSPLOWO2_02_FULL_48_14]|nr:MAG: hypothetical protein A3J23_03725 [Candidatus Peregrinibacteria bacterium RIFCSPLOWO2_02_FULL_48_14]
METRFVFRDFLKVFAFTLVLFVFFMVIFQFVPSAADILAGFHPTVAFLFQYLLQFVILFFPLWFFVVDKYGTTLADFGFKKVPILQILKTVALCYLLYLVVSYIILTILSATGLELAGFQDQQSYLPSFGYDSIGLISAFIVIILVAPFLEELFFRGFIYRVFTKTWPVWLGSILTALLFALIHFQLQTIIPLFILGLILNFAYQKTGSVWTSVIFHSFNNAIAFALDLYLYYHPEFLENLQSLT